MNDNAKALIAALRSGEYKQGKGALARRYVDGWHYCVLGVGCEVYIRAGNPLEARSLPSGRRLLRLYGGSPGRLPKAVARWLGLDRWLASNLSNLNDRGLTFAEIADIIEARPEEWFVPQEVANG